MKQGLSNWLAKIGEEIFIGEDIGEDGEIEQITKDERLARLIWKRALGYEEDVINPDKTEGHRVHLPDPKAQQFIFERRDGKFAVPQEGGGVKALDKLTEEMKQRLNAMVEDGSTD